MEAWHYEGDRKTKHAAIIGKNFWTAEFFIPFALLKPLIDAPPQKDTLWKVNLYRIDYDEGPSEWSWQLTRTQNSERCNSNNNTRSISEFLQDHR